MKRTAIVLAGVVIAVALIPLTAGAFDSGSTGADGDFNPSVSTEVQLPPNGILNYRSVNIPTGVTVTFNKFNYLRCALVPTITHIGVLPPLKSNDPYFMLYHLSFIQRYESVQFFHFFAVKVAKAILVVICHTTSARIKHSAYSRGK